MLPPLSHLALLCALGLAGCAHDNQDETQDEQLVGRKETSPFLRQATVQITMNSTEVCTGSYIGDGTVLTAAGCMPFNSYPYWVGSITAWRTNGERLFICKALGRRPTRRFIGHEEGWKGDVAMWKLDPECLRSAMDVNGRAELESFALDLAGASAPQHLTGRGYHMPHNNSVVDTHALETIDLERSRWVSSEQDLDPITEYLFELGDLNRYWDQEPNPPYRMVPSPDEAPRLLPKAQERKKALWESMREGHLRCFIPSSDQKPTFGDVGAPAYFAHQGKFQVGAVLSHIYYDIGKQAKMICLSNLAANAEWITRQRRMTYDEYRQP